MKKLPAATKEELEASFGAMLSDAISYDNDERADDRARALQYMRGVMADTPSAPGWSSVTTSELADVVGWLMPGLMRIFAGAGQVVEYKPTRKEEEEQASQASDYVAHIFMNECDGYQVLYSAFHDALTLRNGVLKYWWDDAKIGKTEVLRGLSEEQLAVILSDDDIEILGYSPGDEEGLFDLKIQRVERRGKLQVAAVPPEEFLISRRARCEDDAPLIGHRTIVTRSDLVEEGFDKDQVDNITTTNSIDYEHAQHARGRVDLGENSDFEHSLEQIERFECYIRHDIDGDGVAELCQIIAAGEPGRPEILSIEEWPDEAPFASIRPWIVPHSWQGRSIADDVMPMQRVATTLLRQMLDNLYLSNRPQRAVNANSIENPTEILNPTIGGVIRCKGDPRAVVYDTALPFTAQASLEAIRFVQQIIQARTGSSQAAAILDDDALVPQTATSKQIEHDSNYARTELISRNFAETGLKRLFKGILRTIIRNQDRKRTILLRGNWVDFDPRYWNAGMDVEINVGLGTGTKDRDLMMLRAVGQEQEKVIAAMGPDNPIVTPEMYVKTRHQMVAAAGLKNPDMYFADVTNEQMAQYLASKQQNGPDPATMAKLAQVEVQRERNQIDASIETEKLQVAREEMATKVHIEEIRSREEVARAEIEMRKDAERADRDYERGEMAKDNDHARGIERDVVSAHHRSQDLESSQRHAMTLEERKAAQAAQAASVAPESEAQIEAPKEPKEPEAPKEPSMLEKLQEAALKQQIRHAEQLHKKKMKAMKLDFKRGADGRIAGMQEAE